MQGPFPVPAFVWFLWWRKKRMSNTGKLKYLIRSGTFAESGDILESKKISGVPSEGFEVQELGLEVYGLLTGSGGQPVDDMIAASEIKISGPGIEFMLTGTELAAVLRYSGYRKGEKIEFNPLEAGKTASGSEESIHMYYPLLSVLNYPGATGWPGKQVNQWDVKIAGLALSGRTPNISGTNGITFRLVAFGEKKDTISIPPAIRTFRASATSEERTFGGVGEVVHTLVAFDKDGFSDSDVESIKVDGMQHSHMGHTVRDFRLLNARNSGIFTSDFPASYWERTRILSYLTNHRGSQGEWLHGEITVVPGGSRAYAGFTLIGWNETFRNQLRTIFGDAQGVHPGVNPGETTAYESGSYLPLILT